MINLISKNGDYSNGRRLSDSESMDSDDKVR